MSKWPLVALQDLALDGKSSISKPYGSAITKEDYVREGVPVVRGVNLRRGTFLDDEFVFIAAEKADRMPGANLRPGDLVFTHRGTIGQVSMIPRVPRYDRYVLSTSQVKARLNPAVALPEFYYYWFLSPIGQHILLGNVSTVGVPGLGQPVATIKSLTVPHPPLKVQSAIAEVLGALDDKIAANEQEVAGCGRLSSMYYRQFLAVRPTESIIAPLSSFADFVNGRAFTKGATGTGRMVLRIAEITSGPGASTVYNDLEVSDCHLARPGDILFAWSGSLTVARWFRPEAIINQHIFKVTPRVGIPKWLVFEMIAAKLSEFRGIAADKATTMGHIQRKHLDEPVLAPAEEAMRRMDAQLAPLWDRALAVERESLNLTELRDTLLPKLVSGEIRVRDAEREVENAL